MVIGMKMFNGSSFCLSLCHYFYPIDYNVGNKYTRWICEWIEASIIHLKFNKLMKIHMIHDLNVTFVKNFNFFLTDSWPFFDYVFLLPLWKCTAKLAWPIKLKFSGSSKRWIWGLYKKFCPNLTPMVDFTGQ